MKRKLDSRFPAAQIKKIMQSDEDVGKIAMSVPLLVSKALELFLHDLCDRTYDITTKRGAKTLSSSHLKQCVQNFNVFDFLREIVRQVPDLGVCTTVTENPPTAKKRKQTAGHATSGSGKGRGRRRGSGRGHGRIIPLNEVDSYEDDPDIYDNLDKQASADHQSLEFKNTEIGVRNFDLNMELDEDGNTPSVLTSTSGPGTNSRPEDSGWSLAELEKMGVDPVELLSMEQRVEKRL